MKKMRRLNRDMFRYLQEIGDREKNPTILGTFLAFDLGYVYNEIDIMYFYT